MEEKKYLYMKRYKPNYAVIIQYCWGNYFISHIIGTDENAITYTIRSYKTLSGAERFLKEKINGGVDNKDIVPELYYGDEQFIKKGEYWRA